MVRMLRSVEPTKPLITPFLTCPLIPKDAKLLHYAFDSSFSRVLGATKLSVRAMRTNPDGELYETWESVPMLILWDLTTGQEIRRFAGVGEGLRLCALSPDGSLALSGGREEPLRLWDTASGACLQTFAEPTMWLRGCWFLADGRQFIVTAGLQSWRYDSQSHQLIQRIPHNVPDLTDPSTVFTLSELFAFSPDHRCALTRSQRQPYVVSAQDSETGETKGHFAPPNLPEPDVWTYFTAVNNAGTLVLIVTQKTLTANAEIWDVASGQRAVVLHGPLGFARACALSPDGSLALIASDSGAHLWDVATGQCWLRLSEPSQFPTHCAFNADGRYFALASSSNVITVYKTPPQQLLRQVSPTHAALIGALAFTPDGRRLISGSEDETLRIWHSTTRRVERLLMGHEGFITSVAVHPSGTLCASASSDQTVRIWDIETGRCVRVLRGHAGTVQMCCFSPDGEHLLCADNDGALLQWEVATGTLEMSFVSGRMHRWYEACAYSPDGRFIAASSSLEGVMLWQRGNLLPQRIWPMIEAGRRLKIDFLRFTPDSYALLDSHLRLFDAESGEVIKRFVGLASDPVGVVMSKDGAFIAAVDQRRLCLWDTNSGERLAQWENEEAEIWLSACAIHPNNITLAVSDSSGSLLWLE